jgi:hypothetical protein
MNTSYLNTSKRFSETGQTYIEYAGPWSVNVNAAVECPDGIIRKVKRIGIVADTYFSIPAAITYKGKTVAGFITGSNCDDPEFHFIPYQYRKNGGLFDGENTD